MKRGKKYLEALKKIDKNKAYSISEGVTLAKQTSYVKFDESIEIVIRLNIEQKHTIRGSMSLPNSIESKEKRVVVFAEGNYAEDARKAGADYVGLDDLIEKIKGGWLEFDVAIATPDVMKSLGKLGPILGKRGLMPNPKDGTVTQEITKAVSEFKKGKINYRADKTGIVHNKIGKVSMDDAKVLENIKALYDEILRKKPSDIKGEYIKSIYLCTTMGPGIKIDKLSLK
ncbi:MAG TPA: 50S ribosomal protein L1 [Spirochaetota bacterium]|nr:50S ribosomal protein L1 [Spirochaetota bacterium]HOM38352.1 50S ribosomal protein L1 [Spirochaetota bacterium]HPQ48430.1 50S ribosomal protein L1 [Spirochaetota bacterium]